GDVASGMKYVCAGAMAILLAGGATGFAETVGDCDHPIEAPLRARADLVIDSRPAGVEIVGTDAETLRVACTVDREEFGSYVELRVDVTPGYGRLNIRGSDFHNANLRVRIEGPKKTNL